MFKFMNVFDNVVSNLRINIVNTWKNVYTYKLYVNVNTIKMHITNKESTPGVPRRF